MTKTEEAKKIQELNQNSNSQRINQIEELSQNRCGKKNQPNWRIQPKLFLRRKGRGERRYKEIKEEQRKYEDFRKTEVDRRRRTKGQDI